MKRQIWMIFLLVFAWIVSGCGGNSLAAGPDVTAEPDSVQDKTALVDSLQNAGATVEEGNPLSQPFFTPEGSILKVNGADVQVFEYESMESMEEEASQVMPDGGSIGRSMIAWMDTPHFYKAGRIIVLYVGSDEAVLGLLEKVLGPQFAGR